MGWISVVGDVKLIGSDGGEMRRDMSTKMDEDEFEASVQAALSGLPEVYRKACEGVAVRAQSLPSPDTLEALGLSDPLELLGLYHGISLTNKSVFALASMPDTVLIYRLPILAYAEEQGLPVDDVVEHVLIHEIGHHFGLSDDDMAAIEARPS